MNLSIKEIEIIEATKEDHWNLLNFLITHYPDLGWSKEFMQWQYYNNPAGIAKSWVAKHNGNVVANVTAIPHKLFINGKVENGWRVQDVITHPEYRGMGLYSKLSDNLYLFIQRGYFPLNFTFPNENSHQGFIKRNWVSPNRIPLWVCKRVQNIRTKHSAISAEPIVEFTKKDEQIWINFCKLTCFALYRSHHYLNWRYFQNPRGRYYAFRLFSGNKSATCILKLYINDKGDKFSHLIDCFYENGFDDVEGIIHFFINYSKEKEAMLASTWVQPYSEMANYLKNNNFELNLHLTRWHVLNFNSSEFDKFKAINLSNWHISMGDSDVY